ncbi:ferric reductase-like transmembrane domain-containing protein [Kineosporia sp. A_224]|uniref:ferredoxin reductase family protein n=1 Tax=Kineosporia sp. A_224 TaxID=1962180 RepID=UPI000B4B93B0|nr:ferredoxin reductase family protein [Kineosporia sp. A_224]
MTMTADRRPLGTGDPRYRPAAVVPTWRSVRVPAWWRDLVGSSTWASMLVVVGLWVAGGGLQDLGGWASGLTSIGRLTGLVSADLLLVQVLLMARIPLVERSYGQDELARRHRLVGFTSFTLMAAHLLFITLGYAAQYSTDPVAELWSFVVDYPGMLLAAAGTLLLVLVTVTSIRKARKKLRYESWHLLHLYAYLGVGLALPHQLWTGQEFLSSTVATVYWWTLWAAAAAAVLVYRVGMPVYRTLTHDLRVTHVVRESPDVVSVHMRGRHLHRLPVAAGQFFSWRFLDGPGWTRAHPYSLSAAPTPSTLRITVKDLGDDSRRLEHLRPGTRVAIEGPYGRLHEGVRTRRKVTLLASGIGITPLRALLEELPAAPGDITLVYRARDTGDLVLKHELDALAAARGHRVYYVLGPRARRRDGTPSWLPATAAHLTDAQALTQLVPDIAHHDVYLCGADTWMDAARTAATTAGVPSTHIHDERFTW